MTKKAKPDKPTNTLHTDVAVSSREALQELADRLSETRQRLLTPPIQQSLSEWSDRNIILGSTSPEPGSWRTDRTPYLREILDACGDFATQRVVIMASAQTGKSSCLINVIAFYIANDPSPIMIVLPDESMAESFSQVKLEPVINESPVLRKLVASTRKRDGGSKKLEKIFSGGFVSMVSAKSAHSLRSRSIRVLLLDEIDAYDQTLGDEGDPVRLAEARTTTFPNRKIILTSTPTLKDFSRIEKEYLKSDQRRYHVPCPHCDHKQVLRFGDETSSYGLKWEKGNPDSVEYLCERCGTLINESHKLQMMLRGEWKKDNPSSPVAGFHISSLCSPWVSWKEMVTEWLELYKLPDKRQSFVNLKLGEPYEDTENKIDVGDLTPNVMTYTSQVPKGVGVLTCGIDVQESWIECAVWGFGKDEEMFLIDTAQLMGETSQQQVWDELKAFLSNKYKTYSGELVPIHVAAIDSGHATHIVFRQAKKLRQDGINIHPIKGYDGARSAWDWSRYKESGKLRLGIVGSSTVKQVLYSRLKTVTKHGPGFIHFPSGVHNEILEQILSEQKVIAYSKHGVPTIHWKRIRQRNEQLDCMIYAYAVFQGLGVNYATVTLPESIEKWSQEPSARVIEPDQTETPYTQVANTQFFKRRTMPLPRKSGGLIPSGWIK